MSWIVQRKLQRSDWMTIAQVDGTKAQALAKYEYMPADKLRAVSPEKAQADYLAGRADNYRQVLRLEALVPEEFESWGPDKPISKAAQELLRPEWEAMQAFIAETDARLLVEAPPCQHFAPRVENAEEFLNWGPLRMNHVPLKPWILAHIPNQQAPVELVSYPFTNPGQPEMVMLRTTPGDPTTMAQAFVFSVRPYIGPARQLLEAPALIYTFEIYRPPFPEKGRKVVIHRGDFENNRESLSPSTVSWRDFYARDDAHALQIGRQAAGFLHETEFLGFADGDDEY